MADEVLPESVSVRNLSEGGTPLREFKGKYEGLELEPYEDRNHNKRTRIKLNFSNMDVIRSVEPYPFPIATISMPYSTRKSSMWGIFGESLAKQLKPDEDIQQTTGRIFHMIMTSGHSFGQDKETKEDIIRDAWEVAEIEGGVGSGKSVDEIALEILNTKTEAQFNQSIFANALVKNDPAFQKKLTSRAWINDVIKAGKVTKDDKGIYHVVG